MSLRRPMNTRRDRTIGIVYGDPPKVAQAEGKGQRPCARRVVEVETVFSQIFEKSGGVSSPESADLGNVDPTPGVFIAEPFCGRPVVGAKIRVGDGSGAVGVERIHVGAHRCGFLVTGVAVDAVEGW